MPAAATIDVVLNEPVGTINPNLYGHFTEHLGGCIYDGIWQDGAPCADVISALKKINPPVIRWPGGCFADDYHWRDGVGLRASRPKRVNIHWGNVIDDNTFGTHEFIALCRAVGAQPYLAGNVGSGSPREMRDWVEYCNFPGGSTLSDLRAQNGAPAPLRIQYWGVGNENWGCGGHFTPEDYAAEYRRFSTYLRDFGDTPLYLIACGPDGNDLEWTRRFFEHLHRSYRRHNRIHGYAAHYYCGTAGSGSATQFTEGEWYELLFKAARIEDLITRQRAVMDEYDPERRIGLVIDEWGTWHLPTPGRNPAFLWQQNTLRDALVAAITLDTFNRHAEKVVMANIAQAVNVLQALLLTENGKVVTTPTYHVYEMYRNHQGATSVRVNVRTPMITFTHEGQMKRVGALAGSASLKQRTMTLTVTNVKAGEAVEAEIHLLGEGSAVIVRETVLTHEDIQAHNTVDDPEAVKSREPTVVPLSGRSFSYAFAGQSVTRLEMSLV